MMEKTAEVCTPLKQNEIFWYGFFFHKYLLSTFIMVQFGMEMGFILIVYHESTQNGF